MDFYLWIFYIFIFVLAFVPLVRLRLFSTGHKYIYFRFVSIALFIWVLISGIGLGVTNAYVLYPVLLFKYAMIFLTVAMTFIGLLKFYGYPVSKKLLAFVVIFFIIEVVIGLTNQFHEWMIQIPFSSTVTEQDILSASNGIFFYIHMAVSYLFVIGTMFLVIKHLHRNAVVDKDILPFIMILIAGTLGVGLNIIHIFFYRFIFDPTFIFYVFFILSMYFIFIIRDARLIIKLGDNEFLLKNLREMYLIVNHNDEVIDASDTLLNKFDIDLSQTKPLNEVMDLIEEKAIVYEKANEEVSEFEVDKSYIHIQKKPINLPFLKYDAHMILFYDETQIQRYLHDMDYFMNHDLMTGLYNRNYLESIRSKYNEYSDYTCILFDLDGLKLFNDYLGHQEGDDLLIRFANVLQKLSSEKNGLTPIRMGGDEFLLILRTTNQDDINDVLGEIKKQTDHKDIIKHIGYSFGYVVNHQKNHFKNVLSEADVNMYQMKESREPKKKALEKALKSHSIIS